MPITKAKKHDIVKSLQENMKGADMLVFINFKGSSVADVSEFRRKIREAGGEDLAAKKTPAPFVIKNLHPLMPTLEGEVGYVFSKEDSIAVAKGVQTFSKTHKGIKIVGGVFEGQIVLAEVIGRLAKIPPREVLLAQVVGILNAPMSGLARVLNGNQRKLVMALKQIADGKQN